jgi:hypothetical protein
MPYVSYESPYALCTLLFGFNRIGVIEGSSRSHECIMDFRIDMGFPPLKREKKIAVPKIMELLTARKVEG